MQDEDLEQMERVERDPTSAALERARHWIDIERWEQAETELLRALAREPESPMLHFQLARARTGSGRKEAAIESLGDALRCDPRFVAAHVLLGALRTELGHYVQAEKDLLEALRLDPSLPVAYRFYGDLMRVTGNKKKAIELYQRGLALDPDDAGLHSSLALIHSDDWSASSRSSSHAKRGLRLEPEETFSHGAMAQHFYERGRPFAARRHAREALRKDPANAELERYWLEIDRCTRIVYLPMYYWSLLVGRLPGRQFAVWGAMILLALGAERLGFNKAFVGLLFLFYIVFCIYTWLATPLVKGWIKLFPPRI